MLVCEAGYGGRLVGRIKEAAVVEMKSRDAKTESKMYDLDRSDQLKAKT